MIEGERGVLFGRIVELELGVAREGLLDAVVGPQGSHIAYDLIGELAPVEELIVAQHALGLSVNVRAPGYLTMMT
jgi:hypothetical protein